MAGEPTSAAEVYDAYMATLVKEQDARMSSIESRSMAVITSSGALVALMFALVALISGADSFKLPSASKPALALAVVAMLLAASLSIWAMAPTAGYETADEAGLEDLKNHWADDEVTAHRRVFATRLKVYAAASTKNESRAKILQRAVVAEVFGAACVAVAVLAIIRWG